MLQSAHSASLARSHVGKLRFSNRTDLSAILFGTLWSVCSPIEECIAPRENKWIFKSTQYPHKNNKKGVFAERKRLPRKCRVSDWATQPYPLNAGCSVSQKVKSTGESMRTAKQVTIQSSCKRMNGGKESTDHSKMCLPVTKMRAWQVQIQNRANWKMLSDRQGKLECRARKPKYNRLKKGAGGKLAASAHPRRNKAQNARVGNVRDGSCGWWWRLIWLDSKIKRHVVFAPKCQYRCGSLVIWAYICWNFSVDLCQYGHQDQEKEQNQCQSQDSRSTPMSTATSFQRPHQHRKHEHHKTEITVLRLRLAGRALEAKFSKVSSTPADST